MKQCLKCLGAIIEENDKSNYSGNVCTCQPFNWKTDIGDIGCINKPIKEQYILEATTLPEMTTIGKKFDQNKIDWSLLPIEPTEEVIKVLMYGANKYAPDNWKHVEDHERRYYNAIMRHISAWKKGEKTDQETGISHLAHAVCSLLFILGRENEDVEK